MSLALTNCDIFTGDEVLYEHAVLIDDDRVTDIVSLEAALAEHDIVDLKGATVAPGFIDLQVNGGGGVLLTEEPTPAAIRTVLNAHRRFGTTGMLPTFITATPDVFLAARAAVDECLDQRLPGLLGVHFEGPFLNSAKAGVHDKTLMRHPTDGDLAWLRSRHAAPTLLTVAPETLDDGWLARLRSLPGVIVSAGHTDATYLQMENAFSQGLKESHPSLQRDVIADEP